jgi:hypothetical protein
MNGRGLAATVQASLALETRAVAKDRLPGVPVAMQAWLPLEAHAVLSDRLVGALVVGRSALVALASHLADFRDVEGLRQIVGFGNSDLLYTCLTWILSSEARTIL